MKSPYKKDVTPVYEVPFDNPDLVAKANDNGTIIVNKDMATDGPLMKEAIAHEKFHLNDMKNNKLGYDDKSVYYDGKVYNRGSFNEGNDKLAWEAPAYKHGKSGKDIDLTPNPKKLDGKPSMKEDSDSPYNSPLTFKKMGNNWNRQSKDHDKVSMNEQFGAAMKKRWSGPSAIGGEEEEVKKAKEDLPKDFEKKERGTYAQRMGIDKVSPDKMTETEARLLYGRGTKDFEQWKLSRMEEHLTDDEKSKLDSIRKEGKPGEYNWQFDDSDYKKSPLNIETDRDKDYAKKKKAAELVFTTRLNQSGLSLNEFKKTEEGAKLAKDVQSVASQHQGFGG